MTSRGELGGRLGGPLTPSEVGRPMGFVGDRAAKQSTTLQVVLHCFLLRLGYAL
jgi:hypothetical protein